MPRDSIPLPPPLVSGREIRGQFRGLRKRGGILEHPDRAQGFSYVCITLQTEKGLPREGIRDELLERVSFCLVVCPSVVNQSSSYTDGLNLT